MMQELFQAQAGGKSGTAGGVWQAVAAGRVPARSGRSSGEQSGAAKREAVQALPACCAAKEFAQLAAALLLQLPLKR